MAGTSLQDLFFARNQSAGYFFLKHPYRPPTPSKVKWSAPNRPLQQLLKLSFLCSFTIVMLEAAFAFA